MADCLSSRGGVDKLLSGAQLELQLRRDEGLQRDASSDQKPGTGSWHMSIVQVSSKCVLDRPVDGAEQLSYALLYTQSPGPSDSNCNKL